MHLCTDHWLPFLWIKCISPTISLRVALPKSFGHVCYTVEVLAHLAYMPMSLYNHDLSVMCHCHHHHHCWCWHLCTAVPVIALIIETSYLANICTYIPSIFIFGTPQTYTCKCTDTCTHMYWVTITHKTCTDTCMFVYIHKYTYIGTYALRCACGISKEIITSNPLLSQNWQELLL